MARSTIGARGARLVSAHTGSDSARQIAERVRDARANRAPLRIVGRGHWLDAGRPCRAHAVLDLAPHSGIVEYEPGDLTLTARAGTTLAELQRVTRAEGQWLPLDPGGSPEGTLGATIATASAGPLASSFGTPRDQVLGCELVTGAGDVVQAGGRVVKNVAGFDLVRLNTGAWGTLGVLTEVSVRLRALPALDRTFAVRISAADAWRWLRASEYTPLAAELVSPALSALLGTGANAVLLVRFGGNETLVSAAATSLVALGEVGEVATSVWDALAASESAGSAVVRLSTAPSRCPALWERASAIVERAHGSAHATLSRGVVRCILPAIGHDDDEMARLRGFIGALQNLGTVIVERLPAALWPSLVAPAAADPLSVGVRNAFDPDRLLNPGILGELA
ncbi:MAG TPA: FAD-binding protein [Gemmatimonadaceae bacterium]|nr:FAD-binding protein [Gemmatimonadaceae bacterium]